MADFEYVSKPEDAGGPKPPLDLSHHFSRVTAARSLSAVKQFYKYFQIPGIANLAGGLPNAAYFPFDTLEAKIAQPQRFTPTPNDPNDLCPSLAATSIKTPDASVSAHLTVPHSSSIANPLLKIDLTTALQYGTAQGYPPLYSFLRTFARQYLHPNIPYADGAEIILTNGSTDGFGKTIETFTNVWSEERDWIREREAILCEEFAYMNALQSARPRGVQVVPVKIDSEGMLPSGPGGLEDVLENWDESKGKRPHLLYTVTVGQNPTGGTLSIQRRKELYAICSKYDVIIIEDDPYWYLQFPSAAILESQSRGIPLPAATTSHKFEKSSGLPYLDSLVPSYLNFDYDGRVVRLDTFSKTTAPGCRLGWITAQPAVVERILRITETSTQQPSGFVQSMIAELVMGPQPAAAEFAKKSRVEQASFSGWQVDGWVRWLEGLRGNYERRMNRMCTILDEGRYLLKQQTPIKQAESDWAVISKTQLYSFNWPRGGMFVWIQVHFDVHPLASKVSGSDLAEGLWIYLTRKPYLVLAAPGAMFTPTAEILKKEGYKYFRICFAAVDDDVVDLSSKRFAAGVKAFWGIKDEQDLPRLDDENVNMEGELIDMGLNWTC